MDASGIKFGPGATGELGYDLQQFGVKRAMLVTDPNLANSQPVAVALGALRAAGIDTFLSDQVRVEPTDASLKDAIRFAVEGHFDGYAAIPELDDPLVAGVVSATTG